MSDIYSLRLIALFLETFKGFSLSLLGDLLLSSYDWEEGAGV